MSRSSFPRPEHSALLRERITAELRAQELAVEVGDCRLDHYRCCYCFGLRRSPDEAWPERDWSELPIHFQVAERLHAGGDGTELARILASFLQQKDSRVG